MVRDLRHLSSLGLSDVAAGLAQLVFLGLEPSKRPSLALSQQVGVTWMRMIMSMAMQVTDTIGSDMGAWSPAKHGCERGGNDARLPRPADEGEFIARQRQCL